jgi:hypothetical protein
MTDALRKFLRERLDSPGVVVKTRQAVAAVAEQSFGRASDVTAVVPSQATLAPAGQDRALAATR